MKVLAVLVLIAALLVLAVPVSNFLNGGPSGTVLTKPGSSEPSAKRMASLLESRCADCHLQGIKAPFYASIPVVSGMIQKDRLDGLRLFDIEAALRPGPGGIPSEPGLAMIEHQILSGEMPPRRYLAMHWKAALDPAEKDTLLGLIQEIRVRHFAPAGLPREVASRPVHPLPSKVDVDQRKVVLGQKLYHDNRLSGDDTLSCASCHDLAKGGTDQAVVSTGIRGQKGGINAPTTFNSSYQFVQFWDGRAATLEDQAAGPPENPVEMGAKFADIVVKLNADEAFRAEFEAAYPEGISKATLTHAIAEFERTLVTPGSKFDQYLMGKTDALNEEERTGYQRFQAAGCETCHVGRLMGGSSFELMGRKGDYFKDRGNPTPADDGRFAVTKNDKDRQRFKVPTLRNVALTFPYFHDGSAKDLNAAVKAMGRYQAGVELANPDVAAITAFLKTLTGTYQGKSL